MRETSGDLKISFGHSSVKFAVGDFWHRGNLTTIKLREVK